MDRFDFLDNLDGYAKVLRKQGEALFSENPKGLYRKYDGSYVCVRDIVKGTDRDDTSTEDYLIFFDIRYPFRDMLMPMHLFFAETYYASSVDDDGKESLVRRQIGEHPSNMTGQKCLFEKVTDFDRPYKDMTTDELVEELRRREDSPLAGADIEGISESIDFIDYPVARKLKDSEGEFMDVLVVKDNEEDISRYAGEYGKHFAYKRTWIRLN